MVFPSMDISPTPAERLSISLLDRQSGFPVPLGVGYRNTTAGCPQMRRAAATAAFFRLMHRLRAVPTL